jgi:hypothetical protein
MLLSEFNLPEHEAFFTRHQSWEENRLRNLQLSFQKLFPGLKSLQSTKKESERKEAPNYNIFHILGLDSSEVQTHSAFLADLFDPRGSHGQGDIFLIEFLHLCIRKMADSASLKDMQSTLRTALTSRDMWAVKKEKPVVIETNNTGRLDIVLTCRKLKILIVVENKIYSEEGDDQLDRYKKWMARQRSSFPNQLLIYLTLQGEESKTRREDLRLSYREDISSLLSDEPKPAAPSVQEIIRQYLQLIRSLTDENTIMNTKYERELSDWLLSQKENLHVAFEIKNVFPLLKRKLLLTFWDQVEDSIQKKLSQNESTDWRILREGRDPTKRDDWFGIVVSRNKDSETLNLRFKIEQDLPKDFSLGLFFLNYGILSSKSLSGEVLKRIELLPEYQTLQKALRDCGCTEIHEWWSGFKSGEKDPFERFLETFSEEEGSMVEDVVDEFWDLFSKLQLHVDNANQAIAKNKIGLA